MEEQVLERIKEAAAVKGFVLHTVVSKKMRDKILLLGKLHNVEAIVLIGTLLSQPFSEILKH